MTRNLKVLVNDTGGGRTCGTCNLCCTLQGVQEIRKPINVKCTHLNIQGRCGIYSSRPESCRAYQCLWLRGHMPEEMKPVKSRAVLEPNASGDMIVMRVLPQDRSLIHRGILRRFIRSAVAQNVPVIVVCGNERTIYGGPEEELKVMGAGFNMAGELTYEEMTYTKGEI